MDYPADFSVFQAAVAQISSNLRASSESAANPQLRVFLQAVVVTLESASSKLAETTAADPEIASMTRTLYDFAETIHEQHEDSLITSFLPLYFEDSTHVLEQIRSVIGTSNVPQQYSYLSQMAAELIVMEQELLIKAPKTEPIPVESNTAEEQVAHDLSEERTMSLQDFRLLNRDDLRFPSRHSFVKSFVDAFSACDRICRGLRS
ncbi:hypothetical protein C8J57DRAFT_1336213 [Mycena rebaudengoi]|nr:hypothetical protein C8J57DRAFT_1336213 [Mycena rebaudengoi]